MKISVIVLLSLLTIHSASAVEKPQPVNGYQAVLLENNIAPTSVLRATPVEVFGQPRMAKGHPCVYWDQEDINRYKEMLKTNKELQALFQNMKEAMDKRIAEPINIPPPQKGPDGKWMFPGDYFPVWEARPDARPYERFNYRFSNDSNAVADLGTLYVLTGETKYAEYAKKLILAYSVATKYSPKGLTKEFVISWGLPYHLRYCMGLCDQFIGIAMTMHHFATGYDFIYNLPSWTPEERKQVHDELFYPWVSEFLFAQDFTKGVTKRDPAACGASMQNNRGVFCNVAVLAAGYATDDQELINAAVYGIRGTSDADFQIWPPPKNWEAATASNPSRGLLHGFFAETCIPGGKWIEASVGYSRYATSSLLGAAEICWHHGIDLYRHNNAIFKYMFDFPLLVAYPDLTTPAFGDASRGSLINGCGTLYEYAYRRYRDPVYLAFINNADELKYLSNPEGEKTPRYLTFTQNGTPPPSVLFDLDPKQTGAIPRLTTSVNYKDEGLAFLRVLSQNEKCLVNMATLTYGVCGSHCHPDRLHITVFGLGDELMPSAGFVFPYWNPDYKAWFHTTVAHNTMVVDETDQTDIHPKDGAQGSADLVVYAPASTVGLQRAWSGTVYKGKGVTLDRSLFTTSNYLADIFGAFSATPHKYDLAWHIRGEVGATLKLDPFSFTAPVPDGYSVLKNLKHSKVENVPWSINLTENNQVARLCSAAAPDAQVIVGDGGFAADTSAHWPRNRRPIPTILERRQTASTIFGNALDYSGNKEGYVQEVKQEGGLDAGYAVLRVKTPKGEDLCFASYRPGNYKPQGLETDATQAFVQTNGKEVETMYLAGGKFIKAGNASIARNEPGLAYIEKTPEGNYVLGNPSPKNGTVAVTLPALTGMSAFALDEKGQRGAPLNASNSGAAFSLNLKAGEKVLFARK